MPEPNIENTATTHIATPRHKIDITVMSDAKGEKTKSKNATWIIISRKIHPTSPTSPLESNMSTNNDRNSGDTASDGGDDTSTAGKIPPQKEPENDAHLKKCGDIGDGGDIIRLSLGGYGNSSTDLIQLDDKDYVAFDLEWNNDHTSNNRTIYTAAFVDNRGNQKVLHISDYGNSEPALIRAIREEILKYPASIGWYTTGIARRGSDNHKVRARGVSAAA